MWLPLHSELPAPGADRNTKHYVACHGGDRGALLGAFSYRLRPAAK
ncbi:MAG TPA: hypothetical protein VM529_09130 [Gemmata sp.]|nr:hypothetical protein [Gemmata sp.]